MLHPRAHEQRADPRFRQQQQLQQVEQLARTGLSSLAIPSSYGFTACQHCLLILLDVLDLWQGMVWCGCD